MPLAVIIEISASFLSLHLSLLRVEILVNASKITVDPPEAFVENRQGLAGLLRIPVHGPYLVVRLRLLQVLRKLPFFPSRTLASCMR